MAVRICLKHVGKTHAAAHRVVVVDSRKKRDSRVIEELGIYDPQPNPSKIHIDSDRMQCWLGMGTQPFDQVRNLLVLTSDIAESNGKVDAVPRVKVSEADRAATATEAVKAAEAEAEESKTGKAAAKAKEEAKVAAKASAEEATKAGEKT